MRERVLFGLVALVLVACDGPNVPNAPPLQSGPASNTLFTPEGGTDATMVAKAVCARLIECLGGQALEKSCVKDMVRFTSLVIDGQSFVACFKSISCEDLHRYTKIDDQIERCLDLDPSSVFCVDDAMHFCNRQGVCKDVSCSDFCALVNANAGSRCVIGDRGPTCACAQEPNPLPNQ